MIEPFPCAVPIDVGAAISVVVDIWCPPNFILEGPISLGPVMPCPVVSLWVLHVVVWVDVVVEVLPCPFLFVLRLLFWRDRHLGFLVFEVVAMLLMICRTRCVHDDARGLNIHVDSRRS